MRRAVMVMAALLAVTGCERAGNLQIGSARRAPAAPPVAHPYYDPYAAYGEAPARWRPAVGDRRGTIFRPGEAGGAVRPSSAWPVPEGVF